MTLLKKWQGSNIYQVTLRIVIVVTRLQQFLRERQFFEQTENEALNNIFTPDKETQRQNNLESQTVKIYHSQNFARFGIPNTLLLNNCAKFVNGDFKLPKIETKILSHVMPQWI